MVMDPSKTLVILAAYPDKQCDPSILGFLVEHGFVLDKAHLVMTCIRDVACALNTAVKSIFLPSSADHLLYVEKDMGLGPMTAPFLESAGDVVCAFYETGVAHAWRNPSAFHTGLWRTNRPVLKALEFPLFMPRYSEDGTQIVECACISFAKKVIEAGFEIVQAGETVHQPRRGG